MNRETELFRSKLLLVLFFSLALWGFAPHASAADNASVRAPERVVREGIAMEFSYEPAGGRDTGGKILEGEYAQVRFRLTDESTGKPIRSLRPGAWMDIRSPLGQKEKAPLDCRQKVSLYLQGIVGISRWST